MLAERVSSKDVKGILDAYVAPIIRLLDGQIQAVRKLHQQKPKARNQPPLQSTIRSQIHMLIDHLDGIVGWRVFQGASLYPVKDC